IDALTREQGFLAHLTEHELDGELRHRRESGTVQHIASRVRELRVRHRIRAADIYDAVHAIRDHQKLQRAHRVVPPDPTHPLPAIPDLSAAADVEYGNELREHAAIRMQNEPHAGVNDTHARITRRRGSELPLPNDIGKEPLSRCTRLVEHLIATCAVDADGR